MMDIFYLPKYTLSSLSGSQEPYKIIELLYNWGDIIKKLYKYLPIAVSIIIIKEEILNVKKQKTLG